MGLYGQDVAEARKKLVGIDGLGEKVGGAGFESGELGWGVSGGGENEHRRMAKGRVFADPFEDLQAIDLGHHDVEQDGVGLLATEEVHGLSGVGGGDEILIAGALEILADYLDVDRLVVDDHEPGVEEACVLAGDLGWTGLRTGKQGGANRSGDKVHDCAPPAVTGLGWGRTTRRPRSWTSARAAGI